MSEDDKKKRPSLRPAPGEPRLSEKLAATPPERRPDFLSALPYEVGYGKPPRKTRFKAGASGNPKGRPKGSPNLITSITKELEKKVTVTINGKNEKLSLADLLAKIMMSKAQKGDTRIIETLLKITSRHADQTEVVAQPIVDNDLLISVLDHLQLQRQLGTSKPQQPPANGQ